MSGAPRGTISLNGDVDQTALDVNFLGNGLACNGFGHSGVSLCSGNGVSAFNVSGNVQAGFDLAVHLNSNLNGLLHAFGFVILRPLVVSQGVGVAHLLPQFLGHMGNKRVQQLQQHFVLCAGCTALIVQGIHQNHQLGNGSIGLQASMSSPTFLMVRLIKLPASGGSLRPPPAFRSVPRCGPGSACSP